MPLIGNYLFRGDIVKIKALAKENRPREKILNNGIEALSNEELLAVLLRVGNKEQSAIELASYIMQSIGNITKLKDLTITELCQIKGIKLGKAAVILASFELCKRAYSFIGNSISYRNSFDIYNLLFPLMSLETQETFYVLFLNAKCQLIERKLMANGGINSVSVDVKVILKHALKLGAYAIVLAHNHPTGDVKPSRADIDITLKIKQCTTDLDIVLLDHLIIGKNTFFSFSDEHII